MLRLITVFVVICRYRLLSAFFPKEFSFFFRFPIVLMEYLFLPKKINKELSDADRLALAMEELGPVYTKFGQLLSTRTDLFDEQMIKALRRLQDNVKPFANSIAFSLIEQEFDQPLATIYKSLNEQAIASASIAQVYEAQLHDNTSVIIKIKRPDIEKKN